MKTNAMRASFVIVAALAAVKPGQPQVQPASDGRIFTAGRLLTNDSIVRLVKADISQNTILHLVNSQPGAYALGVDDIIALKEAGVSDEVLNAMLDRSAGDCGPAMAVPMQVFAAPPVNTSSTAQQTQSGRTSAPQSSQGAKSLSQDAIDPTLPKSQTVGHIYRAGPKVAPPNR